MRDVLRRLAKGEIRVDEAEKLLRLLAIQEVSNIAKLDVNREFRKNIPEVILGEGKTCEDLTEIVLKMLNENGRAIVSRLNRQTIHAIRGKLSQDTAVEVYERAGVLVVKKK